MSRHMSAWLDQSGESWLDTLMITTWEEAEEQYSDMLDEISGPVVVGGLEFAASRVLREMDPIAYRVGLHDYIDGEGIDSDDLTGESSV